MTILALLSSSQTAAGKVYIEDVFSTYTYTGTSATQTITTGIDLDTHDGMLWLKGRSVGSNYGYGDHELFDTLTEGGVRKFLRPNGTDALSGGGGSLSAGGFTSTGFTLQTGAQLNNRSGDTSVAYSFRKAAKFFDVVTYTGNGVAGRQINHSLGAAPGMIIVKRTDTTSNWPIYHRSISSPLNVLYLNLTTAASADSGPFNTAPTASTFYVGDSTTNANGGTYVAYLFAHDTSADGLIQCGSFTTDGSGNATVTLGWEPQYLLTKNVSTTGNWIVHDTVRDWSVSSGTKPALRPNVSDAESNATIVKPNATGFSGGMPDASATVIYMAIRRGPMRLPTSGTQVYQAIARSGTSADAVITAGFPVDLNICLDRFDGHAGVTLDRLRGSNVTLQTVSANAEATSANTRLLDQQSGVKLIGTASNLSGRSYIDYFFRRYPGVFDEVCYTGTGGVATYSHNLGAVPEMMIVKSRNDVNDWAVYHSALGNTHNLRLNTTAASSNALNLWNNTSPTASVFTTNGAFNLVGGATITYKALLFATLAGISKVGSYVGNGTSQTIDCGFAAGARFVLIKRTDSASNWYIFDTVRGIVAGNDPYLYINATNAEDAAGAIDSLDPSATGFIVNQDGTTNLNVNASTYIYLAFA